jgi:hypothetical protein
MVILGEFGGSLTIDDEDYTEPRSLGKIGDKV